MPIYEYVCNQCRSRFDLLRQMQEEDSGIACPDCGASDVQRVMSAFAALSGEPQGAPASAGSCCGGGCGCN